MIYHLNSSFGKVGNGIDSAVKRRVELLSKAGYESKIITGVWTGKKNPNIEYETMYDYFQQVGNFSSKMDIEDVFSPEEYDVEPVVNRNAYKISKDGTPIATIVCFEQSTRIYRAAFYPKNGVVKEEYYDFRGFLSKRSHVIRNNENERYVVYEVFYTPQGEIGLEKFYNKDKEIAVIKVTHQDAFKILYSEDELVTFWLESFLVEDKDVLIIDRTGRYMDGALAMTKRVRLVPIIHSTHLRSTQSDDVVRYFNVLNNIDHINAAVCGGKRQRKELIERFGNEDKFFDIPVAYKKDEDQISNDNAPRIIFAGRLVYEKDVHLGIRTFAEVIKKVPDAEFHIYGLGPEKEKLVNLADELNLSNKVYFRGYLPFDELKKEYSKAKIMILTSHMEGFPNVLLEAMCYGIPICSFNIRYGPSDLVDDGLTGFLTDYGDTNALAEKIVTLLKDRELYSRFSSNTYLKASEYSEERIANKWANLLKKLGYANDNVQHGFHSY